MLSTAPSRVPGSRLGVGPRACPVPDLCPTAELVGARGGADPSGFPLPAGNNNESERGGAGASPGSVAHLPCGLEQAPPPGLGGSPGLGEPGEAMPQARGQRGWALGAAAVARSGTSQTARVSAKFHQIQVCGLLPQDPHSLSLMPVLPERHWVTAPVTFSGGPSPRLPSAQQSASLPTRGNGPRWRPPPQ